MALERQFPDADEILRDADEALFHLVNHVFGPVDEMAVDLFHRLLKVSRKLHFLPEFGREMGSFDGLHVEIYNAIFLLDLGVLRVGERTRFPVAKSRQIVLVAAEVLRFCLDFVRTKGVVDDPPNDVVLLHCHGFNRRLERGDYQIKK